MRTTKFLKLFGLLLIGFIILISCSSDDDSTTPNNPETPSFVGKWWYDSNDFVADIYFYSDGAYQQKKVVQGVEYTGNGNWTFENENSRIIKIENLVGNGQFSPEIWLKISNIQNNTITVQQSTNGVDYSEEFFYQDTNN